MDHGSNDPHKWRFGYAVTALNKNHLETVGPKALSRRTNEYESRKEKASMSITENKQIVLEACQRINERNFPALFDLMADHGTWTYPIRSDRFRDGGRRNKKGAQNTLEDFLNGFDEFSFEVRSMTAEEDRVAVEATAHGVGPDGLEYNNTPILMFKLSNGKLAEVTEALDPFEVLAYVEQLSEARPS
jgi:ketosteroid isomerase-like protein